MSGISLINKNYWDIIYYFTDNVVELLVTETNQYATEFLNGNLVNLEDSYTGAWTDIDVMEMNTFIRLLFHI